MTPESRTEVFARGYQTFMGLQLKVSSDVLIPRAETELLARTAAEEIESVTAQPRVIDMCSGSGNLACALAVRFPQARVWAADATEECVRLAEENVQQLNLQDRVSVFQGNLFESLSDQGLEGSVDLVVCNPPYISSHRLDSASNWLLSDEPRAAFDGGPYGLDIMSRLVREAPSFLRDGGVLAFEFGEGQHLLVQRLLTTSRAYRSFRLVSNAEGKPRVAVAHR